MAGISLSWRRSACPLPPPPPSYQEIAPVSPPDASGKVKGCSPRRTRWVNFAISRRCAFPRLGRFFFFFVEWGEHLSAPGDFRGEICRERGLLIVGNNLARGSITHAASPLMPPCAPFPYLFNLSSFAQLVRLRWSVRDGARAATQAGRFIFSYFMEPPFLFAFSRSSYSAFFVPGVFMFIF